MLSNAFKGLLLNSYVNIKFDLAVKSFQYLINKPRVEIYDERVFEYIKKEETPLISKF